MLRPPCYNRVTKTDCPDRSVTCHGTCKKWAEYEAERDVEYRHRLANSKFTDAYDKHCRDNLKYRQRLAARNYRKGER